MLDGHDDVEVKRVKSSSDIKKREMLFLFSIGLVAENIELSIG